MAIPVTSWLPAVIGGASSLLGAGINSAVSYAGAQQTNKTNKEIAEMNNQTMIQLMREQTDAEQRYNSIGAQMQRAMAAGVNPMLLAGAQPTSASAAGVPSLQAPDLKNPFQGFDSGLTSAGHAMQTGLMQAKSMELQSEQIDNAKLQTQVDTLKTVAQLIGNTDLTSDDVNKIVSAVMGDSYQGSAIDSLLRDQFTITRLSNAIETSNIDKDTKKYLFGWLDEFTNAQFTDLLASTEMKQTQSNVNRSLVSLNSEKKKEIVQAIKNMEEQWTSLNATAQMDIQKLQKFAKYFDAQVKKLENDANLSEKEARYYLWSKLVQHPLSTSWRLGPIGGSNQDFASPVRSFSKNNQPRTDDQILLLNN